MRTTGRLLGAVALAGATLLSTGCQDTPLTAGANWQMNLTANPGAVTFDPNTGVTSQNVDLFASVLTDKGIPQSGVAVYFAATVPGLASGKNGVKTDGGGIAHDTLKASSDTATSDITVTASSASLNKTLVIKVTTTALNLPPVAAIIPSPKTEQRSGASVVFDGSASTDPNKNDFITMYKWLITSTNPDPDKSNPYIAEGPAVSGLSFPNDLVSAFTNVQDLTVSLSVTDDPNAPANFANKIPIAYRGQQVIPYSIVAVSCSANTAPTAVLSGPPTQNVVGLAQSFTSLVLDGSLSSDPETPIDVYNFNCGNGQNPVPSTSPAKVTCKYFVDNVPHTYTATLVVVDRGTGQIVGGQYQCQKESNPASVQVVVTPTTVPGG